MSIIRKTLFQLSASTRLRNRDVAGEVKRLLSTGDAVIDAGCGEYGLAPFLGTARVVGVDIVRSAGDGANFRFVEGSIVDLPFAAGSFAVAVSVDTIEHLPESLRPTAIAEMMRVSSKALVVSFPRGVEARRVDEDYRDRLRRRGRSEPEWLSEHLAEPYPTEAGVEAMIRDAAAGLGREVRIRTVYSEPTWIASSIRTVDSRSGRLALLLDLAWGAVGVVLPRPSRQRSYRAILTATFS